MKELVLYHATDTKYADAILKEGFKPKVNDEHWLGQGAYFFFDDDLARWWATNPSKKFGSQIQNSCILQVRAQLEESRILDLRKVDDYKDCIHFYHRFKKMYKQVVAPGVVHSMQKYRCSFFTALAKAYELDAIIGCFTHDDKPYLSELLQGDMIQLKEFKLPFVETQVCIRKEAIDLSWISIV